MENINLEPWQRQKYNTFGILRLHEEIEDFCKYISPTQLEKIVRQEIVDKLRIIFTTKWPKSKMHVFGSFATDLYLPTSDIDVVLCGEWTYLPLRTVERMLEDQNFADDIRVIAKAKVPIVKFVDRKSGIAVDISFNKMSGVENVEMIKQYLYQYKPLKPLFLVIKHFMVQRDLSEVYSGGLGSFCLIILVISFLQHYNCRLTNNLNINYGVLLMEFFELYGRSFNFINTAISINDGGKYIPKSRIETISERGRPQKQSLLSIIDPIDNHTDIARSCYGLFSIRGAFAHAFTKLSSLVIPSRIITLNKNNPEIPMHCGMSPLKSIISFDRKLVSIRDKLSRNFAHIVDNDTTQIQTYQPDKITTIVIDDDSDEYCHQLNNTISDLRSHSSTPPNKQSSSTRKRGSLSRIENNKHKKYRANNWNDLKKWTDTF